MREPPTAPRPAPGSRGCLVLVEPEIPNNTGTIGRLCVGLGLGLHLVHPIAFDVNDRSVRRSGLDYWPRLRLAEHADWPSYRASTRARVWLMCAHGGRDLSEAEFFPGDHLVLGSETRGLPQAVLDDIEDRRLTIPMVAAERSFNLAVSAGIAAYEYVRTIGVDPTT